MLTIIRQETGSSSNIGIEEEWSHVTKMTLDDQHQRLEARP